MNCCTYMYHLQEIRVPSGDEIEQLHSPKSSEVREYWIRCMLFIAHLFRSHTVQMPLLLHAVIVGPEEVSY